MAQNNYIESGYSDNHNESKKVSPITIRQRIGLATTALITALSLAGCVPPVLGQEGGAPQVEDYGRLPPVPTPDLNPNDNPGVVIEPRPEGLFPPPLRGPQLHPPTRPAPVQNSGSETTTG